MSQNLSTSQRFKKGAGSVGTILAVLVAILIGYLTYKMSDLDKRMKVIEARPAAAGNGAPVAPEITIDKVKEFFKDKEMITFGKSDSKVLFIESLDPGCPWCHVAGGLDDRMAKKKDDSSDARFVTVANGGTFKPPTEEIKKLFEEGKASIAFLLVQTHSPNNLSLKTMYCSHKQGKFWEARAQMLTESGYFLINPSEDPAVQGDTNKPEPPTIESFVTKLANIVDPDTFRTCMSSTDADTALTKNSSYAQVLRMNGTPTMMINTKQVDWSNYDQNMLPIIKSALGI